ncbi:hypothetical protein V8C42DRAFT_239530 [Trichoderma barbatum]
MIAFQSWFFFFPIPFSWVLLLLFPFSWVLLLLFPFSFLISHHLGLNNHKRLVQDFHQKFLFPSHHILYKCIMYRYLVRTWRFEPPRADSTGRKWLATRCMANNLDGSRELR